jgi:hypothetical protein
MNGWELKRGSEAHLRAAVNRLAIIVQHSASTAPPDQFREVGRKATRKELDKLAAAAKAVVACVDALHKPAILALADRGVMREPILRWARSLVEGAQNTDVSGVSIAAGTGRPGNNLATVVAANVIRDFERLTGGRADFPADSVKGGSRGLVPLVRDVFAALAIKADAKASVSAALAERAKNTRTEGH